MAMHLPTVTIDDLRAFHAKHFPNAPIPANFLSGFTQSSQAYSSYEDEDGDYDDDLGYYPDGCKRTLTDEQIALFRHTEIQTILRERRHRREANAAETPEPEIENAHPQIPDFSFVSGAQRAKEREDILVEGGAAAQEDDVTLAPASELEQKSASASMGGEGVLHGRIEKPPQWRKRSKKATQQKNARSRKAHRKKRKEERKNRREGREGREGGMVSGATRENDDDEGDESDEWDPWHQAKGPDALEDEKVELEY
ncbi:uncharacterized protein EI97DRAFT_462378 [Westerdykella ornata]|uniref:Uncharacterized protein n=1 Tax=Westerdykella ornata TaxID=318751 RepID=A0A6A6J6G2_WESOR|nr:uncharacterized protein EI97DRAFT_462378 [Westerdykella ornata]KAF2271982.1 hypothetical protein EI97DRAFT_462378 [Westerdykella ornata]